MAVMLNKTGFAATYVVRNIKFASGLAKEKYILKKFKINYCFNKYQIVCRQTLYFVKYFSYGDWNYRSKMENIPYALLDCRSITYMGWHHQPLWAFAVRKGWCLSDLDVPPMPSACLWILHRQLLLQQEWEDFWWTMWKLYSSKNNLFFWCWPSNILLYILIPYLCIDTLSVSMTVDSLSLRNMEYL